MKSFTLVVQPKEGLDAKPIETKVTITNDSDKIIWKLGNDVYPCTDEDIKNFHNEVKKFFESGEQNFITSHIVEIQVLSFDAGKQALITMEGARAQDRLSNESYISPSPNDI